MKRLQQLHSRQHEYRAHHQSATAPPETRLYVAIGRHAERLEDQQKDKNIVHAERFFHEITGEKFQAHLRSLRKIDPEVEKQRNGNPRRAFQQRFPQADRVRFAMKHAQVNHQGRAVITSKDYPDV